MQINSKSFPASLGYQTLVELYGCSSQIIDSKDKIEATMLELANIVGLTVVKSVIHEFSPIGISGVIVIEESHLAIHTWPEHNYIAIDFFTCNQKYNLELGISFLVDEFKAVDIDIKEINRGPLSKVINPINKQNV